MSNYITLSDVEVESIEVRVSIEDVLGEADTDQLVEALKDQGYEGEAFLEDASAQTLWEALGDASQEDLIELLVEHNYLEGAATAYLTRLHVAGGEDEVRTFLQSVAGVSLTTKLQDVTFHMESLGDYVHFVRRNGVSVGVILPDVNDPANGPASLRLIGQGVPDTGMLTCPSLGHAQQLARVIIEGAAALGTDDDTTDNS